MEVICHQGRPRYGICCYMSLLLSSLSSASELALYHLLERPSQVEGHPCISLAADMTTICKSTQIQARRPALPVVMRNHAICQTVSEPYHYLDQSVCPADAKHAIQHESRQAIAYGTSGLRCSHLTDARPSKRRCQCYALADPLGK